MNNLENYHFAVSAGMAVARGKTPRWEKALAIVGSGNHSGCENLDSAITLSTLQNILKVYQEVHETDFSKQEYWQVVPWNNKKIDIVDYAGVAVSFTDFLPKDVNFPDYLTPPQNHMRKYFDYLLTAPEPPYLYQQFEKALEIVGPYPTAACILLMICSRTLARDMDKRITGELTLKKRNFKEFPYKIASFSAPWVGKDLPDAPGNTYYFWTTMTMGMLLGANKSLIKIEDRIVNFFFINGTELMWFGRKYTAGEANLVTHEIPLKQGLVTGKYLVKRAFSKSL